MYLMTCTRPDLAYPLSILARYVAPGRDLPEHWEAAKRVLSYLCSTSGMGLVLGGRGPVVLTGHTDASWVDDLATQRSSQGYTFSLGSGSISWRSTRSSSFLGSSCEAEIYAGAIAALELRWLTYLLTDLGERPRSSPVLRILPGLAPRLGGAALAPFPPHGARSIAAASFAMATQGAPPAEDGGAAYDYDLVVIGGGSGGLACSKEAAKLGKKVACLDFVKPTPSGTQWGLGGTCVNVGCIPKKLMHQAALLGESFSDARAFGWDLPRDVKFDWAALVQGVGDHIGSLNWGYRVALRDGKVTYVNAMGRFVDAHTLECTTRAGQVSRMTAERFVIAVGGRPRYLGVPGDKDLCITSDDIFSLQRAPGKTLCVGASYISLETAGFLAGLGFPVSVMPRSILLRGFDQEVAEHIGLYMERHGVSFIRPAVPTRFDRTHDGKVAVTYKRMDTGLEGREEFDTVVIAVGRDAQTQELNLAAAGVDVNPLTGKIIAPDEQTSAPHIYAIGDVLDTRQELTPVAIKAGQLLAHRLYSGSAQRMDYNLVPTTVFTPLEYGCIGMAEELAIATYGPDNIEVYHSYFKPLEWQVNHEESNGVSHREDNVCYAKLVCNKLDSDRVLGLHVVGPNAGEITQGYAVAMRMGACKADFDATVGIHPTMSEEFTSLRVTRRSGLSPFKTGC
ncbi:unnamed protein product [Closterium sp. NIES-53]